MPARENILENQDSDGHKWQFVRIGGFDHVLLKTGEDLKSIPRLDQKLWAALSCPTHGLEFDPVTLEHMDKDKDGRIRTVEVIEALNWTLSLIKNPDDLVGDNTALPLSAINNSIQEGRDILLCAAQILSNAGKEGADKISPEDMADKTRIFANSRFNGDGIITPPAAEDEDTRQMIEEIMDCVGSETNKNGLLGITRQKADQFFKDARAYADWWAETEGNRSEIFLLGEDTEIAARHFETLAHKIDDYFTRCRLAAFDSAATRSMNPAGEQYEAVSRMPMAPETDEIKAFPLARIEPAADLPLMGPVNPAWEIPLSDFRDKVVQPWFKEKKTSLSHEEWMLIKNKFSVYEIWKTAKNQSPLEKMGLQRIREILDSPGEKTLAAFFEKDKALEPAVSSLASLDRLIHYYRSLYTLLNNFISFHDFYTPGKKAVFQAGTLYLDGRSCDLCIRVKDPAAHSTLAQMGGVFLAYCECTRKPSKEKITIAAAFTQGDSDNLMVGRNGVFYDRNNQDWDATIVKIIDHPISVRQAFWAPYKRTARMIREQIEKFAAERDKAVETSTLSTASGIAAQKNTTPAEKAFDVGKFAGIFAAIGLAIGAIGTAVAAIVTGLLGLQWWQIPLAFAGLILVISGPSIIMAFLKLRQRNLSPILDACGWAVNSHARINIPFGNSLTHIASLPAGSSRRLKKDPFAEKKGALRLMILILILILAVLGLLAL